MNYTTEDDLDRLKELYRRLTPRQIAQLRGTPYAVRQELQKASVLAARNVIERQFQTKTA